MELGDSNFLDYCISLSCCCLLPLLVVIGPIVALFRFRSYKKPQSAQNLWARIPKTLLVLLFAILGGALVIVAVVLLIPIIGTGAGAVLIVTALATIGGLVGGGMVAGIVLIGIAVCLAAALLAAIAHWVLPDPAPAIPVLGLFHLSALHISPSGEIQ